MFLFKNFLKRKKVRGLSLFSGGLDSMLAVKILEDQGISVTGICFVSNFFDARKASILAKEIGIELRVVDIRSGLLDLVKNPPSGYGKNLNPCVDCHSLMIRRAGQIAAEEGFDFVATGEVLGQRPFSQNKEALLRVREISGVDVLRPLSAKLLPETSIETRGLVDRRRLLDFSGRGRERHHELIQKYKIKNYPSPAGGCVLTDGGFCARLHKLLQYHPECTTQDVEILKNGRVFWFNIGDYFGIIIVGRHHDDNKSLQSLAQAGDFVLELKNMEGPLVLLRYWGDGLQWDKKEVVLQIPEKDDFFSINDLKTFNNFKGAIDFAGSLCGYYASKARGKEESIKISYI